MPSTSKGLRYPDSSDAPNIPQDIQNLASDVDELLFTNGGTTSAVQGPSAPDGVAYIIKTIRQQIVTNASGDGSVTLPSGAFANGVLSVQVITATAQPFVWVVNAASSSTSVIAVRAYNIQAAGAVAGSLSIAATIIVVGW